MPVSFSTHDNAIQTIKIETSACSADVTTQSASSADSTKTPAHGATMEMQKYSYEYKAQLMLHEVQLKLQEAINGDNKPNWFVSATMNSMKCLVNWIPLRIRVRFINTQPHREARSGQLSGGGMNVPFLSPPESKINPSQCVARP